MKFKVFQTLLATTMLLTAVESSATPIPLDSVTGHWEGACYDCNTPINQPTGWDYQSVTFDFSIGFGLDNPDNGALLKDGIHSYFLGNTDVDWSFKYSGSQHINAIDVFKPLDSVWALPISNVNYQVLAGEVVELQFGFVHIDDTGFHDYSININGLTDTWYIRDYGEIADFGDFSSPTGVSAPIVDEPPTTSVPEPSTLAMFALGMIGLASRRFKKQS
jgi:hypothetical protein